MPTPPVIDTLSTLVGFPTVSPRRPTAELAAWLAQGFEDLGFRVERFVSGEPGKVNLICSAGPTGTDGLILSGHLDVVPTDGQRWTSDPFTLTPRGDRLVGRGSSDMKGFVAASLEALKRIDLAKLRRELVLIWTADEEVGCLGSAKLAAHLAEDGRPLPTECWIGEPSDFRIMRMHPGHVGVRITTRGEAAHSSKPDLGASAIKAMTRVMVMLEDLEAQLQKQRRFEDMLERPWTTMNMGTLQGGQAVNIVPDHCELVVGYRPLPGEESSAVFEAIQARLQDLDLPDGTEVSAEITRATPSLFTPEGTPLQGLIAPHACSQETCAAAFATDGGNLAHLGIQTLVFGPGSIDVAHKADEYVSASALIRAVDIVEDIVRGRCQEA